MNVIETRELTKRFGRAPSARPAVDRLTLQVPAGIAFGFIGPNGAGKTTTIRMLCGILPPTAGSGQVAGADLRAPDLVRSRIGYANQSASVYADLTVEENLTFRASLYLAAAEVAPAVARALERFHLRPHRRRPVAQLSGGWRNRLTVAIAMVHTPRLVFLDEPTAGIDPSGRRELWDIVYTIVSEGSSVFVSTHHMDEAERCQRIALIDAGRVLADGTPDEVRRSAQGHFYEVETTDLAAALSAARTLPGVRDAWIRGSHVRLAADRPVTAPPGLDLRPAQPLLEDAFVALAAGARATERSA